VAATWAFVLSTVGLASKRGGVPTSRRAVRVGGSQPRLGPARADFVGDSGVKESDFVVGAGRARQIVSGNALGGCRGILVI
jgi:hypothetical protein